ncbi:hypothetical protein GIB67_005627 [Kingdonia uniflora]|uniref:Uncharacterized protein n=1 Tax=Kingdonia uniflora TaxID=39325 RepID=A0A7J7NHM7_9MAGN|nr:hypothetical protein GIB67_005627 [Kingdonia uniflora]
MKSTVERKKSLLDEVAEEETELELVLGELGLSRNKRVESRSKKVAKAQSTRSMTGVDEGTRQISGEEVRAKTPESGSSAQPNLTTKKVTEGRSASVDDLKEVEERARLAILQGKEDTSQMIARLVKGIWLGIEKQEFRLKKAKRELEKNLALAKIDALKEVKQLKAAHAVAIGQLQVEAKANLDETTEECDRLDRHLMLKGYSQEEVDVIKADTYTEEEEEVLGFVNGLDGVSTQMVLDNQGDDAELPEGGSEKVELDASRVREDHALMCNREFVEQLDRMKEANENREDQYLKAHFRLEKLNQVVSDLTRQVEEKDSRIKKGLEDLSEEFIGKDDELRVARENLSASEVVVEHLQIALPAKNMEFREMQYRCNDLNERVVQLKAERDQAIARAKKSKAIEHSGRSRAVTKAPLVQGDVVSLPGRIRELESVVAQIHGVDADRNAWKNTYVRVKVHHERLKARFAKVVAPDISRSTLLTVIVTYFVEEVKRLESEWDTLLKTLSDKGCTCRAGVDRGNYLGAMETQLGPRTTEFVERGKAVVARKLKDRPLDDVGECIADTPTT